MSKNSPGFTAALPLSVAIIVPLSASAKGHHR
jgi:hypothetical protein